MPIDDSQDFDLDAQEPIVLDEENEDTEDTEADDSSQDDNQDDSNLDDIDENPDDVQDDDDEPVAAKGRGQSRHQVLANRAKAAEAEAERYKAALAAERERLNVEKQAIEDAKETERLASMQPHERDAYEAKKDAQSTKQAIQLLYFKMEDSSDKSMYSAKSVSNPLYAKYADRVEAKLADMRKQGQNSTREVVLDFLIGRDARLKVESGAGNPRKKGAALRMDAARSKPARGRSDAGYKPKGRTAEDRLEGVYI